MEKVELETVNVYEPWGHEYEPAWDSPRLHARGNGISLSGGDSVEVNVEAGQLNVLLSCRLVTRQGTGYRATDSYQVARRLGVKLPGR